jgi:hypothetical protein
VQNLSFSAREKIQPAACLPASAWARGPATDEQAAISACHRLPPGPFSGMLAPGRGEPSISANRDPMVDREFCRYNPPVSGCSPGNPRPFHLSPPPRLTNTCLTGGGFGLARGRRWPATVKGGAARHAVATCSSLPPFSLGPPFLPYPPQHARSRVRPPMAAVERCGRRPAGDGEDEPRRP